MDGLAAIDLTGAAFVAGAMIGRIDVGGGVGAASGITDVITGLADLKMDDLADARIDLMVEPTVDFAGGG